MTDRDTNPPLTDTATQQPQTVETGRGTVAYAEYGDPDGDPVLFHGTPGYRLLGALWDDADGRDRGESEGRSG